MAEELANAWNTEEMIYAMIVIALVLLSIMAVVIIAVSHLCLAVGMMSLAVMLVDRKFKIDENSWQLILFGFPMLIIPWIVRYQHGSNVVTDILIVASIVSVIVSFALFIILYFRAKRCKVNTNFFAL